MRAKFSLKNKECQNVRISFNISLSFIKGLTLSTMVAHGIKKDANAFYKEEAEICPGPS